MKDWLTRFYSQNQDITLTLNGQTFDRTDCKRLGGGSEKHVYQIPGQPQCFFIPNKWSSEKNWDYKIRSEKFLLDQIEDLGLKTQRFQILPLVISEPGQPDLTINVLMTKDLQSLCQEESLIIYNPKGAPDHIIGLPFEEKDIKSKLTDIGYAQQMLQTIIKEYALAVAFSLPTHVTSATFSLDDSEHLSFELPKDQGQPPIVRYMFWDVVSDFDGLDLPMVPTLSKLKSVKDKDHILYSEFYGINSLANFIACAISLMNEVYGLETFEYVSEVQESLLSALKDDEFLIQALIHARKVSVNYLYKLMDEIIEEDIVVEKEIYLALLVSSISTENVDILKRAFQFEPKSLILAEDERSHLYQTVKSYENQSIIELLKEKLPLAKNITTSPISETPDTKEDALNNQHHRHNHGFFGQNTRALSTRPINHTMAISAGVLCSAGFIGGGLLLSGVTSFGMAPLIAAIVLCAMLLIGSGLGAHSATQLLNNSQSPPSPEQPQMP